MNTGTTIKTMLQLATPATRMIQILEWGFSLDDPPGADGVIELLQADVAATVTAHVASGVPNLDPNGTTTLLTLGSATGTGYTSTNEGTVTATRPFDTVSLSSVSGESGLSYVRTFMPDDRPIVAVSKFLRVRATTPTTGSDMRCFVTFQEVG
ncbi:hypothetical protein ACFXKC_46245 [Streptomyces sp. NPDC059340]|uniref:hypothetical protein n=1 Tax=Streptomyces sp. NPDC059340 TaxID=3346806 RepID=UPI0036C2C1AE